MTISHITNGKVASEVGEEDALGFMRQMGAIPALERATA